MRPKRIRVSTESLILMGVPKKFCSKTIDDFNTFDLSSLIEVKEYISSYINNLEQNIKENKGICFIGSNGVGKTMLSCIILKEAYINRYSCYRITYAQYLNAYTNNWKDDIEITDHERYISAEFLVLEEIGKELETKLSKPVLEELLRYREEHGLVTIICTNLVSSRIKELYGESVCSLINGNMDIIKITGRDMRY